MEKSVDYFDTWMKSQEEFVEGWVESTRKLPQAFLGMEMFKNGSAFLGNGFQDLYTSWFKELMGAPVRMQKMDADVLEDLLAKMTGDTNVYMKFYETWLPVFQAMQERIADLDAYQELLDPAKYKEVLDQLFGFTPEAATEFTYQTSKITESCGASAMEFGRPWAMAFQKNFRLLPELVEGRPETFLHIFHNLFSAFDNTIGKAYHIPPMGKDREKMDLLLRGLDDFTAVLAKGAAYQYKVYTTGMAAGEKVLESLVQKVKNGQEIKSFKELFDLWIDINEREFIEVFRTEAFSKLQGEFLDAFLKMRQNLDKLWELHLSEFPIALRSEMDDVYKTVYDLKKKVRNLEKQLHTITKEAAL